MPTVLYTFWNTIIHHQYRYGSFRLGPSCSLAYSVGLDWTTLRRIPSEEPVANQTIVQNEDETIIERKRKLKLSLLCILWTMAPSNNGHRPGGIYNVTESGILFQHGGELPTPKDGEEFLERMRYVVTRHTMRDGWRWNYTQCQYYD